MNITTQPILKVTGSIFKPYEDQLSLEEPLEIILNGTPIAVTMRTPGNDFELATGFLLTEGIIKSQSDLDTIQHCCKKSPPPTPPPRVGRVGEGVKKNNENKVEVTLKPFVKVNTQHLKRNFYTTSSCGVCGKASIEAIRVRTERLDDIFTLPISFFYSLPDQLRKKQSVFEKTGGLHAAALFDLKGNLKYLREDVGRHNAVDKVVGTALLKEDFPLSNHVLMVSGRSSFEIMQKAVVARIPIICAVSAPSSLAVELAKEFNATLIGFLRGDHCNVYAGQHRIAI